MTYATQQDLVDRYGETEIIQISDRANTGAIDVAVVAAKLADADAEIDGYLVGRYTLPLSPVPAVLTRIAGDIARYHLQDDNATEQVTTRYKDAIAYLMALAKGTVSLGPGTGGDGTTPAVGGLPEYCAPDPVWSRANLKDFVG